MKKIRVGNYELTEDQFFGREECSSLDLNSLTSIPEGFNPTVGGSLDLRSLTSIPEGFKKSYFEDKLTPSVFCWQKGKYMMVDGIFAEVLKRKGNVWWLKKIGSDERFYCVTDGQRYAHGDTIKRAKEDLIYKIAEDASKEEFADLSMTDVLDFEKCIQLYRVVTGACAFGVRNFIEVNNIEHRSYSVAEILEKTKGQYGSESLRSFLAQA
jgi:hypothetical protein